MALAPRPPVAARIREARKAAGLTEEAAAERLGLGLPSYRDLEADDDEAFMCLSLARLSLLGSLLGVAPRELLLGEDARVRSRAVSFTELCARLNALRAAEGVAVAELSERVGWELRDVLVDPNALWNFNVDGLRDVCAAVGVDWVAALPE